ncbi:MAG: hypothetical protein MUO58_04760 [Anaerolineales bacterium]|nr:hypothetical protein [Anaerolineales bacterium]
MNRSARLLFLLAAATLFTACNFPTTPTADPVPTPSDPVPSPTSELAVIAGVVLA